MSIELATKYLSAVDERFATESKSSLVTNQDYSFQGAKTVKIYKISTGEMNDYGRDKEPYSSSDSGSRYGDIKDLSATTETMTLSRDRSFTFVIDKLDEEETDQALSGASALARQIREVVVPEVDSWVFSKMCSNAGIKADAADLDPIHIYDQIMAGSLAMDNEEVPETNRVLIVTPEVYYYMKLCDDIVMETDIGADMRIRGVVSNLDGMTVLKVPASRLPENFGFMIGHPSATVAPQKLRSYRMHSDPPGINGTLVEGRICYDAFVLDNRKKGIFFQAKQLHGLTLSAAAGTNAGDTAITVTEEKGSGNVYKYAIDSKTTPVYSGMDVTSWTTWDGSSDITADQGDKITIVEATSTYKAVKAGCVAAVPNEDE